MTDIDEFASDLLEQSRALLERGLAENSDGNLYLNAAVMLGFCSLEAHINAIAYDYQQTRVLPLSDQSILSERDVKLEHGEFKLGGLKIYRLEDRILHLHAAFGSTAVDRSAAWWGALSEAIKLRNQLTHPRAASKIQPQQARRAVLAIVDALQATCVSLYGKSFPSVARGVQSKYEI